VVADSNEFASTDGSVLASLANSYALGGNPAAAVSHSGALMRDSGAGSKPAPQDLNSLMPNAPPRTALSTVGCCFAAPRPVEGCSRRCEAARRYPQASI
jgi:hypothetical protein